LEKTNFSKFGYPQVIISDQGPQFKGEVWRKMLATLQISARLTTTAHLQRDGQSERAIQNLIHQLRLIENDGISVSEALPKLEFSINNRLQSATKQTPNSLTFCYDIRGPGGTVMSKRLLEEQHRESKTNLILAQDIMKKNYDKTRK
jgi:hypothetical protein